jgi:hypothetical protein
MKPGKLNLTRLAVAAGCALSLTAAADEAAQLETARTAAAAFGAALKAELTQAMQTGGPVTAIEVCKTRAPTIAEEVSLEQDVDLYRVSLKNRNPENAPNAWQREVLLGFEERKAAGEDPATLAWHATVDTPSGREFRFMKAIPTGGLCLACHGATLAPDIAAKIDALYTRDQARGYAEGDIRGAFVVIEQY